MSRPLVPLLAMRITRASVGIALALVVQAPPLPASQDAPTLPETQEPETPPDDPWDRATPRGTVLGFLLAGREGRWADAARYLDLPRSPSGPSTGSGSTLARHLKFLLDRELWIDLDAISDDPQGDRQDGLAPNRERIGAIPLPRGDFEVLLERVQRADDGVPVWKFSSSTVARVPAVFAEVGYAGIVDLLPRVLVDTRFLEVALWQWIGLIVLALASWIASWIASRLLVGFVRPLASRTATQVDDRLLELTSAPSRLLAWILCFNLGRPLLRLSVPANHLISETSKFLVLVAAAWLAWRVIELLSGIAKARLAARGRTGASSLVPLGARAAKVAVLLITALATLDTFGFDVTAMLAGLGVGGLAVALAAQKTVENAFGGVSVLVDQPVRPGDFCRFGDKVGTVEDIGLRSTRIRTLDRTVISVPNSEFASLQIENFAPRDRILLVTTIGLRYETTPDQMRYSLAGLRRVLVAHPRIAPDPQRVRFVGFGSSSLDLEVFAYVETSDYNDFLAVREDLFLRFMDVVAESGTGFAFPSTTVYLARDGGLDDEKRAAAEAQVAAWRAEGRLMFPDFDLREAERMRGTIDWPPSGSVASRS